MWRKNTLGAFFSSEHNTVRGIRKISTHGESKYFKRVFYFKRNNPMGILTHGRFSRRKVSVCGILSNSIRYLNSAVRITAKRFIFKKYSGRVIDFTYSLIIIIIYF